MNGESFWDTRTPHLRDIKPARPHHIFLTLHLSGYEDWASKLLPSIPKTEGAQLHMRMLLRYGGDL
jgi:hypothetical protein